MRRGQANVVSLMIIIAAVLAVALAMYSYYINVYSRQSSEKSIIDLVSLYTAKTRFVMESLMENTTGGEHQYCVMASIINSGGTPLKVYVSLLPIAPGGTSIFVDPSMTRVPIDYQAAQPTRRELVWLAEDIDRNGIIDLLGSNGVEYNGSNGLPNCDRIYTDYNNGAVTGLNLPVEAQVPGLGFYANMTKTEINGPTILEVALAQNVQLPNDTAIPFWNFTVPAFGKVEFFIFLTSPVDIGKLSLTGALMNPQDGRLILYMVYPVRG